MMMMLGLGPFLRPDGGAVVQPAEWPVSAHSWGRKASHLLGYFPSAGQWDSYSSYSPVIVKNFDGTPYKDADGWYYIGYTGTADAVNEDDESGLVKTKDFREVFRVGTDPIIPLGGVGDPDRGDAQLGDIKFDGATFHAYYSGNATAPGAGSDNVTTCYATHTVLDGTAFTKQGQIVARGPDGDNEDIYKPVVCQGHDGNYYMIATGKNAALQLGAMLYTASAPGGTWTRVSNAHIFRPGVDIFTSEFYYEQNVYQMFYAAQSGPLGEFETFYVTSDVDDPETWTDRRKILAVKVGGSWDRGGKYNAMQVKIPGRKLLLYNGNAYVADEGWGCVSVPTGISATLTSAQDSYTNAEELSFDFTNAPTIGGGSTQSAWVGVYPVGSETFDDWRWTDNTQVGNGTAGISSGTVTFPADTFDPGDYEARLNFDGVEITSDTFTVSN